MNYLGVLKKELMYISEQFVIYPTAFSSHHKEERLKNILSPLSCFCNSAAQMRTRGPCCTGKQAKRELQDVKG